MSSHSRKEPITYKTLAELSEKPKNLRYITRIKFGCIPEIFVSPRQCFPVANVCRIHRRQTSSHGKAIFEQVASPTVWKPVADLTEKDWLVLPRNEVMKNFTLSFPKARSGEVITERLEPEIAWLIGAYVAEGHTAYPKHEPNRRGIIVFSLGQTERGFAKRIIRSLKCLDLHGWVSEPLAIREKGGLHVLCASLGFCRLLDSWCGRGARNKRAPDAIRNSTEDIIRDFLQGLIEGDGCFSENKANGTTSFVISTSSVELAYDILEMLHKIGVHGRVVKSAGGRVFTLGGRSSVTGTIYSIWWSTRSWKNRTNKNGKIPYGWGRLIGNNTYLPVKQVERIFS